MDIFSTTDTPATSVDACTTDGFHLNNGIKTSGGSGILLLGGEAFSWQPWAQTPQRKASGLLSKNGLLSIPDAGFGILEMMYPKPDLLLVGTGSRLWMLSKETRAFLGDLGIRVDVMDTANAAAAYNLLATERGVDGVGAAFFPSGWRGPST
jgi:NADH dehydrogenase [ubiquinone] 1 alpha subcomplex assembly factor 3